MGRTPCCEKNGLKKGPWTPEEDQKLIDYIQRHGHGSWRALPKRAGLLRCGKSCRLRWTNYLRPDIKRGQFSFEEEHTIIELHAVLGNKWSAIAAQLPGRTDNEIKNYWNTHLKKRLLQMGIDPVTHMPTIDVFGFPSHMNSQFLNAPALTHMTQWENARVEAEARLTKEYLRHAALMANQNGTCTAADLLLRSCRNQIDRDPNLFRNINSVSDQANWAVEQPRIAFDHSKASSHQNLEQLLQSQTNYSSSSNIPNQIDIDHGAGTLNQDNGSLRRFLDSMCSLALGSSSLDIPAQNTSTSSTISPLGGLQMKIKREPLIRNENVDLLQSRDDQFLHKQTVIGNNGKIINLNGHEDTFVNSKSDIKVPYDDHNGNFTGNYNGLLPSALLQGSVPQKDNVISCIDNDHHVPTTSLWRKDQLVNIVPKNDDQSDSVSGLISSTSTTNIFSQPAADLIPFMINSASSMENSNCYRGEPPSDPESNPDEGKEYWSSMLKSVNGVIPAFQIISAQQ